MHFHLLSSLFFLTLLPQALSLPSLSTRADADIKDITDTLLFWDTITAFEAKRNATDPPKLDWTSDGCSDSPDKPLGFNFLPSCQRHDFGYRNYKAQARFTDANKGMIDRNFRGDMDNECETKGRLEEVACKAVADFYYEAVKEFGHKKI